MKKALILTITLCAAILLSGPDVSAADKIMPHPHIEVITSEGTFKIELVTKEAPKTVAHILRLVDDGFYDGLIFHRVIAGFMVQTGGYTPGFKLREDDKSVINESGNSLSNARGTIAMARTDDPHSANSQFFINVVDNQRLDPQKSTVSGRWGYTVFGYVFEGMEVVDKIAAAQTSPQGEHQNAPLIPIVIKKMAQISYD
ncbi:MAG: peptidylprolyl isomerase [Gammaproteobacteria bacterium]|nr:peptidylprolyl isomerase [Gammaproteobacteria bacterium]